MKLQKTFPKILILIVLTSLFLAACSGNGGISAEPTEIEINMAEEAAVETAEVPEAIPTSAPTLPPTEPPAPTATVPVGEPTPNPTPNKTPEPLSELD